MKHVKGSLSVLSSLILVTFLETVFLAQAFSQSDTAKSSRSPRIGISLGMGVNYHTAEDIVNLINGRSAGGIITSRVSDFKSGVDFFGAVSVPVSPDWLAKLEYDYLLASYTESGAYGSAEFSYNVHMPTLIGQYVLSEAATFNLKAGVGIGYYFATYTEKSIVKDASFTGKGIGTLIELEGNTALGEALYAHLGVQMRWAFIGNLTNGAGNPPLAGSGSTNLHFFGVGARLGMTYYL